MSPRIGLEFQSILLAATDIADQDGIESLTISALANKLNIKPPSLYNHVDNLEDLRNKLALYGLKMLYQSLETSVLGKSGDDAIKALSLAYVNFARKHPGLYLITLRAPGYDKVEHQTIGRDIIELVLSLIEPYKLKKDKALHVVRGLRSLLHGFASLEQSGGFGLDLDLDESFDQLIKTYLRGVHEAKSD